MKRQYSNRGQTLIVVALALAGLAAIVGLVVDGGNAFLDRRNAQNAADSAALAAALTRIRGINDISSKALQSAAQNGYDNNGITNSVEVYSPPKDGAHAGEVEYIQVIITSHVKTYFARIVGRSSITNVVTATARTKTPEITQVMNGFALISLAPSSNCNNQKSFWIHGNAVLSVTGGGVFVNSNNKTCALIQNGGGSIHAAGGASITVVGGASIEQLTQITPGIAVGAIPVGYPPPFFMPEYECEEEAEISEDGTSMTPGSWDEEFPPQGVETLEPGVYCLQNGLDIKHDIEGTGVTFKVESGDVRFANNANIVLSASSEGNLTGLLIYVPPTNNNEVTLNGGANSSIQGTILAPASPILIKGMASPLGFQSQIIGYSIEIDGSDNINITYNDAQNYNAMNMPEVQLSE